MTPVFLTLTTPQALMACFALFGVLSTIAVWIYSLGSRLSKGSGTMQTLQAEIEKLQAEIVSRELLKLIERRIEKNEDDIKSAFKTMRNQDSKFAERFGVVENKLTKIATTLEMIYQRETGLNVKINED